MREAAAYFVGEHDFAAFRTAGCAARTTVRRIDAVDVTAEGELVRIDVKGSGFLRNMVRIMVGTLVGIGEGKHPPEVVAAVLAGAGSVSAGATAPPHGLCLMEVYY
jgi:tRNA pseudouridine38-40 synthase